MSTGLRAARARARTSHRRAGREEHGGAAVERAERALRPRRPPGGRSAGRRTRAARRCSSYGQMVERSRLPIPASLTPQSTARARGPRAGHVRERREEARPRQRRVAHHRDAAGTTAVTVPTSAATAPDSKAPSSLDALMKTNSTAPTRPAELVRRHERERRRADVHADHVDEARRRRAPRGRAGATWRGRRRSSRRRTTRRPRVASGRPGSGAAGARA